MERTKLWQVMWHHNTIGFKLLSIPLHPTGTFPGGASMTLHFLLLN